MYRITLTDQDGTPITAPRSSHVSIVLRPTDPTSTDGIIARYVDGAWHPIKTSPGGFGGPLLAVVRDFGDFAVIAPGPGPTSSAPVADSESPPSSPGTTLPAPASVRASPTATQRNGIPASTNTGPGWLVPALVIGALLLAAAAVAAIRQRRRRHRPIDRFHG